MDLHSAQDAGGERLVGATIRLWAARPEVRMGAPRIDLAAAPRGGTPGGSGQLRHPRGLWSPSHCPGCASEPPPAPLPLPIQVVGPRDLLQRPCGQVGCSDVYAPVSTRLPAPEPNPAPSTPVR
eukprot:scaffold52267_cov40-Phaeocystis_antarctica.AAC.2